MSKDTQEQVDLCKTEQVLKLLSLVDESVLDSLKCDDMSHQRSRIAKYLLELAQANKLLERVKSTSTLREMLYAIVQKSDSFKSKDFFSKKRANDKVSKAQAVKRIKSDKASLKCMSMLYSNIKSVATLLEVK